MSKTYALKYHLAAGVTATVDGVSQSDVNKLSVTLQDDRNVITVGGRKTNRLQLIPVRNILIISVDEESEATEGNHE